MWEEVQTWWSSSRAMCCVPSQSDPWSPSSVPLSAAAWCRSPPSAAQTDPMLSSPFRIAGICVETSRTRGPGKQWVCTLPSANVARTCRTMESPTITATRSVSRRGVKRLRVEISKTRCGGGGEVVARGLDSASSTAALRVCGFPAP